MIKTSPQVFVSPPASCYDNGQIVWQGKDSATVIRVKDLCGIKPVIPAEGSSKQKETTYLSNNKVFIVYGHDIEAREQLELLLRRMKLEPVILQNLPIAGDTIIEKLEANIDVRYACVLLQRSRYLSKLADIKQQKTQETALLCKPARTKDGVKLELLINVARLEEIERIDTYSRYRRR